MQTPLRTFWPFACAAILFLVLVASIAPWSELPVNDDWQYAHVAKNFAERGTLNVDVSVAPTLVGQTLIAWPVIRLFGFSHLALRLVTIVLSVVILAEVEWLLRRAAVSAAVRFVALCTLVANPLFLHLSMSFMTENYGYCVALLSACVWFYGRDRNTVWAGILAAAIAGYAFWIRQFSGLVFPALLLAELTHSGLTAESVRRALRERAAAVIVWVLSIGAYFYWATVTGNYKPQFAKPLSHLLSPAPLAFVVESGIYVFYLTFCLAPFLVAYLRWEKPSLKAYLIPSLLIFVAVIAWLYGDPTGLPAANLRMIFPFLGNTLTFYGIGPITLTDVYWEHGRTPRISPILWMALEVAAIGLSVAWGNVVARVRATANEVGLFGVYLAMLSFVLAVLAFQYDILDRYHYPGILGFTLALAVFLPSGSEIRLRVTAFAWLAVLAVFSTLGLHDYFRWNEGRAELLVKAQARGITLAQVDAGYEPNGWNTVEGTGASPDCGEIQLWFCPARPFRIGLEQRPSDRLILERPVDAWLVRFPNLKLLQRQ